MSSPLKPKGCGTQSYLRASISVVRNSSSLFATRPPDPPRVLSLKERGYSLPFSHILRGDGGDD
jgi:hypothetical protein